MSSINRSEIGPIFPITPWQLVKTHQLLPLFDVEKFAHKHNLDSGKLSEEVESGLITADTTISALSLETGMTEQFFRNLTARHKSESAKRSDRLVLEPGTYTGQ